MIVRCAATSETGRVREANEDSFALHGVVGRSGSVSLRATTESEMFRRFGLLLAVADGMGGSAGGAEASRIVLARLSELYYARPRGGCGAEEFVSELRECVRGAAGALAAAAAEDRSLVDAGTTLCAMALQASGRMALLWAGDSRGVWVTAGSARQLTSDHTPQAASADGSSGESSAVPNQAIYRYVDARAACSVDVAPEATWVAGERYALGTDGWHGSGRGLPWDGVVRVMREAATPEAACEEMVAVAVEVDGSDNATALVVWCEE